MIRKMMWLPVLAAALMTGAAAAQPDGFLRTSGERIVDGRGQEVLLRGMGLGGWMLQEGYMLGIKKEGTQHSIKARIAELIGKEDTERFYRLWRQNHMTRADADRLAASGFNSIRLPMHYNLFTLPIEEEPVKGSDTWLATGFELTDNLLEWCRANRMYLILDLHAAPGGQGKDANISDYDPRKPSLWESGENRRKTVALWRKLAERYANEPWIGGYDILNEPNWTFEGKDKNGKEDVSNAPIWELYKEITKAIREVDAKHIIIVEGNGWGNNYNGFPGPWDRNLVMSFHKYWNPNTEEAIAPFLALREKYRVPVWLGESGENTNEWFRECVALVEKHGIGWAWWPHKKVGSPRCIMTVTAPDDFKKVVAYWNGEGERPSRESAARGLFGLVENLKADKCGFNADVAQALIPERAVLIAEQETACEAVKAWTTAEDHKNMLDQLGIKALRPGPSGNEKDPNHANYDEALANPFPDLPDVLVLKSGRKVTTAAEWTERRKEIVEEFEREVVGRIPATVPLVKWSVVESANGTIGEMPVAGRQLVGRVDNSGCPGISVEIQFTLVTPADAKGPVPVMIMFRGGGLGQALGTAPPPAIRAGFTPPPGALGTDPPATEQLIADGWGFGFLNPASIQADNGAGLTRGIIGLVNKGQPRKPDDWGSLRAWSWGAARALDYMETDPAVDAKRVGIEGVSRYGKAALVTMAFEPRFAVVLVGSSGEGGAKLHRRNFGEAVENLTGAGGYHWMAGNFLKYGASEATVGSKNAGDLPVDAHELIALCAPRPTFISYGIPEKGDAKWLDQQGSFMATVAAGPVFRLLGVKDLGTSDDYKIEKVPGVNVGLLDGHLAWRQHDGGHTDAPNWKHFIPWADRLLGHKKPQGVFPADKPAARYDVNSLLAHAQLLEKAKAGGIDVYFAGDSITRRWGATDYPELLANWTKNFFGWNAANFGWGADRTENILWRLEHGELDGVNPKVIVVLAGTNNVGAKPGDETKVAEVTRGLRAILDACRRKAPGATIVLTAIFPRNDNMAVMPEISRINENIARFADNELVRYLEVNAKLADKDGRLLPGMMHDGLHPTVQGYQVWADGLKPILTEVLGPPAGTDHAPPPTGDPSAKR